jgi:hypothetical protein
MEAKRMSRSLTEEQAKAYLDNIKIKRQVNTWQIKLLTFLFGSMMWLAIFIIFMLLLGYSIRVGTWLFGLW